LTQCGLKKCTLHKEQILCLEVLHLKVCEERDTGVAQVRPGESPGPCDTRGRTTEDCEREGGRESVQPNDRVQLIEALNSKPPGINHELRPLVHDQGNGTEATNGARNSQRRLN